MQLTNEVAMNILDETALPVSKVPDWVQQHAGFRPNRSTVFRWTKRGCRGKKLSTFRAGGRVCTTVEALLEFFREEDAEPSSVSHLSSSDSEAYLASEGI